MSVTPSPVARHVLHPFKIGLGITARSTWMILKFATLIGFVCLGGGAIAGALWGVAWLVHWSKWTLIPLSFPVLLVFIWLVGVAAVSIRKAQDENEAMYSTLESRDY